MAGEKLSARQKMIGMMYLVLTALLALQVSSSVLDQFALINKSLEQSVAAKVQENAKSVKRIQAAVADMGNRKNDLKVLDAAKDVKKETQRVIRYVDSLKAKLIALTGGINKKTGWPKGLKNEDAVARLMLNGQQGKKLKKILNGYVQYLSKKTGKSYTPIALDAKDSDLFKNDPNQANKDFASLYFERVPLGAVLATLSQFSSEVVYAETQALEVLARNVGAEDIRFDNLKPVVKPRSNIVAAGAKYRAELFLAASSSSVNPQMSVDGKKIRVKQGVGNVEFVASSGKYDKNGLAKKIFKAAIKLNMPGQKASTFVKDIEYFVARPVIQVQAAAVQALYFNCGNELNIQVPALGADYNPTFKVVGAELVPGNAKGRIVLVPKAREVKLQVYSNGSFLDTQTFRVRAIPRPDVVITSRGKTVDEKRGMPAPGPRRLEARVLADESFKTFLPKDARYRVAQWEISLARGSRALKTKKVKNSQEVSLSDFAAIAKAGDRIVIEIKTIERLNFKGKIETVKTGSMIHTISLT